MMQLLLRRLSGESRGAQGARRAWPTRSGLLIELSLGSLRGLGEASPLPGYSPDTLEEAEIALGALDLGRVQDALRIEETSAALKAIAQLLPQRLPAARMGLETAALDLRARQRNLSAPELLGAAPDTSRQLAYLLGILDTAGIERLNRAMRAGYQHFKIKLGAAGNIDGEVSAVRQVRRTLGARPRLRLDVNGGWSQSETQRACNLLEPLDIEFVEEPCAPLAGTLGIRVPLALDESLQGLDAEDLEALARRTGASVVILKPMVLGGLSQCLELASRARSLGLKVVISHTFDGPVALLAAAVLALALPTDEAQGLAPHPGLRAWPKVALPIVGAGLHAWSSPGLGLVPEQFG
jgi:o-succinylbenzoate synthase